ncbi:alpha/beta hydrolase [Mycobacterium sp. ACS4331]|uniref:alpha/beta hydrolase n=1 Tax=Mycobacterium sp. ACS4331 TaxID=1834121 RepID=UPI000802021F|nr:alpha/beta hydrolase [Mycobacterium sp. ACS4331]OBF22556.1 alpha/beta hydrolase [Mycobacterium sp. ACS4331]
MPPTTMTVDGFPIPVDVSGPETASAVVLLGAARQATAAYEGVCQRLHTASLRTVVIGPDPRLKPESVISILDWLDVPWAVLVGDRSGADLAWPLAARRLDRFTALVVVDRGHPSAPDVNGHVLDETCPPVEMNTTALVSTPAAREAVQSSQRYVFGDFRVVDMLGRRNAAESTAQLAGEIVLRTSTW